MRPTLLFVIPVVLLVADIRQPKAESSEVATGVTPSEVTEVAPGVFVRQGRHALMGRNNAGAIANTGFIIGRDSVAVVDSGGSFLDGKRLRAAIKQHTTLPIAYVINTHVHPDHIFGNAAFLADDPVFLGHRNLPRSMQVRGGHYLEANRERLSSAAFEGTMIIPPTQTVEGRVRLELGERTLVIDAHPTAHTDSDLTVFDQTSGTLWTGDLLFQGHIPVLDGRLKGWLKVMGSLAELPAARAVPGHGPVSLPWPEALEPQRAYLTKLAQDLRRLIAEGATMRQASSLAGLSEREKWLLFEEFNTRNATAGFAELEWE